MTLVEDALALLPALEAALEAEESAEEREAGVVVSEEATVPDADVAVPVEDDVTSATAPAAQVAAEGRFVTPWPAQRESAKAIVSVSTSVSKFSRS